MELSFRAKLPNGEWFYQRNQYLPSFLRRVLAFWGVSHESHWDKNLEDVLEIRVDEKWVQCELPEFFRGEKE